MSILIASVLSLSGMPGLLSARQATQNDGGPSQVSCKRSRDIIVDSIISSREDAISLFKIIAGNRAKKRGYRDAVNFHFNVSFAEGVWHVYGENVGKEQAGEVIGNGGLLMAVEACTGRVLQFKFTR